MDGYITTTEAAAREGVSVQAIRKRIERGSMAGVKVGGSWMVPATGWEPVTVTVTGPSGCGKTRLAGAIAELWKQQGGTVHRTERGSGYERLILSAMDYQLADRVHVSPVEVIEVSDLAEGKGRLAFMSSAWAETAD